MSAPRAAAQVLRLAMSLGYSFRPLLRGRGRRSAPSLPSLPLHPRADPKHVPMEEMAFRYREAYVAQNLLAPGGGASNFCAVRRRIGEKSQHFRAGISFACGDTVTCQAGSQRCASATKLNTNRSADL